MARSNAIRWPSLPRVVQGAGGPITVRRVKVAALEDGETCWGTWQPEKRLVKIARDAPKPHQWRTLYHELVHAALHDAGVTNLLTADAEETLCECISCARIAELRTHRGVACRIGGTMRKLKRREIQPIEPIFPMVTERWRKAGRRRAKENAKRRALAVPKGPKWTGPVERRAPESYQRQSEVLTWFCRQCRSWTMNGAYRTGRCNFCQTARP